VTRWSNASIRVRLTSWYSVALALMLIVYATATYLAVRHEFYEQFDDQLHDDYEAAENSLAIAPNGRVIWPGDRRRDPDAEERGVEVWSATGDLLYRSDAAPMLPPVLLAATPSDYQYASLHAGGHLWRTLTAVRAVGGRTVLLRVTRPEDRLRTQLWEILVVLVFGLPVIVGLAAVGGYILARRALTPIDHLASEARRITADRLHERLSVPNQHDEIGRLAAVINETFGRLESSFDQLRRFTADASHELRTPLAVIRGTGEATLSEARTVPECQEAIGSMLEEVDRLTTLVDTLLRLSHGDAGTVRLRREPISFGQVTRDAVGSLGILAEERNQRIAIDINDDVAVTGDRLVLREAITNVVDNAIKYSPPGSTISIRVATDRDEAVLTVSDQGPGIPTEHRERIFDRFFRIDEARSRDRGGAGLGLAIAKWAVDVNGGRISVADAPTRGSEFRISMPMTPTTALVHERPIEVIGGHA
jgi:heavy metal sensor kinase